MEESKHSMWIDFFFADDICKIVKHQEITITQMNLVNHNRRSLFVGMFMDKAFYTWQLRNEILIYDISTEIFKYSVWNNLK